MAASFFFCSFGLGAVKKNTYKGREKPDFYKLYPHFGKFHDIARFTVDSIFIIKFHDFVHVFRIVEIMGPY